MLTKPVEFHDEASVEYEAALDFDAEVDHAQRYLSRSATAGQHPTRPYLLRKFPYILIYRGHADDIQIVAVAHTSRRPGYWKKQLRK